jgi:hypothetical protein
MRMFSARTLYLGELWLIASLSLFWKIATKIHGVTCNFIKLFLVLLKDYSGMQM